MISYAMFFVAFIIGVLLFLTVAVQHPAHWYDKLRYALCVLFFVSITILILTAKYKV